jgi:hypothetical protein
MWHTARGVVISYHSGLLYTKRRVISALRCSTYIGKERPPNKGQNRSHCSNERLSIQCQSQNSKRTTFKSPLGPGWRLGDTRPQSPNSGR